MRLNSSEFCRIEFSILRSALRQEVILDLGFCSRRPHRDARPVFQFKNRHLLFGNLVALDIPDRLGLKILDASYYRPKHFKEWVGAVRLGEARNFLQKQMDADALSTEQKSKALLEIYAAEGSDWFWWYGPDFSTENDDLFDELFRQHLKNVYTICGSLAPAELDVPITRAKAALRYELPWQLIEPEVDGRLSSYFEWLGAGSFDGSGISGNLTRSESTAAWFTFIAGSWLMAASLASRASLM